VEFWLKLNTVGQSNAVEQVWIDGHLAGDWAGLQFRTSSILRVNSLQLSFSGGGTQTQRLYMDEILVTKAKPPAP
jgi:hypothetical protein